MFAAALMAAPPSPICKSTVSGGERFHQQHAEGPLVAEDPDNESAWSRRLPGALIFLFGEWRETAAPPGQ